MTVEFEVPALVEYVGLLRMLVSSLAADRRDLDDDRLDDLRLAVSEACNIVIDRAAGDGSRLVINCDEDPEAFVLEVHDGRTTDLAPDRGNGGMPEPERLDEDASVPIELIRALVDAVDNVTDGGVQRLRLRVLCPPAGG